VVKDLIGIKKIISNSPEDSKGAVLAELALVFLLVVVVILGAMYTIIRGGAEVQESAMAADALALSLNMNPENLLEVKEGVLLPADDFEIGLQSLADYVSLNASVHGSASTTCAALFTFETITDYGFDCDNPTIVEKEGNPISVGNNGVVCDIGGCAGLHGALAEACSPLMSHPYLAGLCYPEKPKFQNLVLVTRPNARRFSAASTQLPYCDGTNDPCIYVPITTCEEYDPAFAGCSVQCCPAEGDALCADTPVSSCQQFCGLPDWMGGCVQN